jgi:hypothetical protein
MLPPAVQANVQRRADSVARRMLAEKLDREARGSLAGHDDDTGNNVCDEAPLLLQREVVPVLSHVDRQPRVKVA